MRLALIFLLTTVASAREAQFPGTVSELRSPKGNFIVQNLDSDSGPHHTLLLKEVKTGKEFRLHSYPRHVRVLWHPEERAIAITDYHASNASTVLLCTPGAGWACRDLQPWADFALTAEQQKSIASGHRYLRADGWTRGGYQLKLSLTESPDNTKKAPLFSFRCGLTPAPCYERSSAGKHMDVVLAVVQAEMVALKLPPNARICVDIGDRKLAGPEVPYLRQKGVPAKSGPNCLANFSEYGMRLFDWRLPDSEITEVSTDAGYMTADDHIGLIVRQANYRAQELGGWRVTAVAPTYEDCSEVRAIRHLPFHREYLPADPAYDALRAKAWAAVPCLIGFIDNDTPRSDPRTAPGPSDVRVGDVAFWVVEDITELPYNDMFPPGLVQQFKERGVFAYFEWVNQGDNRKLLQKNVRNWYLKNRPALPVGSYPEDNADCCSACAAP